MDVDIREVKKKIPRQLWRECRSIAIYQGATMAQWLTENLQMLVDRERHIEQMLQQQKKFK